jgi:hypothetical protein
VLTRWAKGGRSRPALPRNRPALQPTEPRRPPIPLRSTSEAITEILKDLHDLKKPDSRYLPRRNDKRPFEVATPPGRARAASPVLRRRRALTVRARAPRQDETSVEFLCMKNEASVFGFGSHSKKRPNCLVLGRLFNYKAPPHRARPAPPRSGGPAPAARGAHNPFPAAPAPPPVWCTTRMRRARADTDQHHRCMTCTS